MFKIGASVLTAPYSTMKDTIIQLDELDVDYFHIDVMDGYFVPTMTFGSQMVKEIRSYTQRFIDVHLMVRHPENFISSFIEAGADQITIHVEATRNMSSLIQQVKEAGVRVGIALNPETSVDKVFPILSEIDNVLQMTVKPGVGGQQLIESTLENVKKLAKWKKEFNDDFDIQIDGGVNTNTIKRCIHAGAEALVVGSALIDQKNWQLAFNELREQTKPL